MPCATMPEVDDVLTLLFQSRGPPLPPAVHQPFAHVSRDTPVWFFTDGTCRNPTIPYARHAAWALVGDMAFTRDQRIQALEYWHSCTSLPPVFHVLDRGLVPGVQSIPRAELCAAIQAVRHGRCSGDRRIHVVTDSSYVMHVLRSFQEGSTLLHAAPNQDLLQLLQTVWYPGVIFQKVKSHLDPSTLCDPDRLWLTLGNMAADEACLDAVSADLGVVKEMVSVPAAHYRTQQDLSTFLTLTGPLSCSAMGPARGKAQLQPMSLNVMSKHCWIGRLFGSGCSFVPRTQPLPHYRIQLRRFSLAPLGVWHTLGGCGGGVKRCSGTRFMILRTVVLRRWSYCATSWRLQHRSRLWQLQDRKEEFFTLTSSSPRLAWLQFHSARGSCS